jgi:hypothetical protein
MKEKPMAKKIKAETFPGRHPIDVAPDLWLYEEPGCLLVVKEITVNGVYNQTVQIRLPWSKVARSAVRWLSRKRRKSVGRK